MAKKPCRNLLMELEEGTKFIMLNNGKKYVATGIMSSRGRYFIKPILSNMEDFDDSPHDRSGQTHVRIIKK